MKILNNTYLTELSKSDAIDINGGDDVTEAFFYAIGYWVVKYSEAQSSRFRGARSHGFI